MTLSQAAKAEEPLFDAPTLNDAELAEARAGFMLPSGVEIDFGAVVTTSVDGARLLQTELQINADGIAAAVSAADGVKVSIAGSDVTAAQADGGSAGAGGGSANTASSVDVGEFLQASVELPDLVVRHLIGRRISSVIVNTADNRVVDNQVSINLSLDNVQPLSLGSIGFRIQALSLDAALSRLP